MDSVPLWEEDLPKDPTLTTSLEDLPFLWGGWRGHIKKSSPNGFFISPNEMKNNLTHVGFLTLPYSGNMYQNFYGSCDGTKVDPRYFEYDPTFQKIPVDLSHGYIKTTWDSVSKQFMLFDQYAPPTTVPLDDINWAQQQVEDMLRVNGVKSVVKKAEDVNYNFQSTSGFGFQQWYGNKGSFLHEHDQENELFWRNAHLWNARVLWKVSGKEEYIKFKKINTADQRCFEIPPVPLLSYGARCNQYFNEAMDRIYDNTPIKVGIVYQNGGFHRMVSNFISNRDIFGMGDVEKWDKKFWQYLRMRCKQIRINLFDPDTSGMSKEEYVARQNYLYLESTDTFCILPWSQVIKVSQLMKSGDWNTTNDNTLGHLMVALAYVKHHFPGVANYKDALKLMNIALYSDDHILAGTGAIGRFLLDFGRRSEFYGICGFKLKTEDDVVSTNIEDLTFLGAKVAKVGTYYVPVYDAQRVWSSIVLSGPTYLADADYYAKLYSLCFLLAFDAEKHLKPAMNYLTWFVNRLELCGFDLKTKSVSASPLVKGMMTAKLLRERNFPIIPNVNFLRSLWLGLECSLPALPSEGDWYVNLHTQSEMSRRVKNIKNAAKRVIVENRKENKILSKAVSAGPKSNRKAGSRPRRQTKSVTKRRSARGARSQVSSKTLGQPSRVLGGPAKETLKKESQGTSSFDKFVQNACSYLHTLQQPFTARSIGIPEGNLASCKYGFDKKFTIRTDTNGRAFVTFGMARSPGAAAYSLANAGSFLPNVYQAVNMSGADDKYHYVIGNYNKLATAIDPSDLFKTSQIEYIQWDAQTTTTVGIYQYIQSMRAVSFGIQVTPLGEVVSQKGTLVAAQFPRGVFNQSFSLSNYDASGLYTIPGNIVLPMNQMAGFEGVWKPTDITVYNYEDAVIGSEFVSIVDDENNLYDQGAFILFFDGCEPDMEIVVCLAGNYEGLGRNTTYLPGVSSTMADTNELDMTKDILSRSPWGFLTSKMHETGNMEPSSSASIRSLMAQDSKIVNFRNLHLSDSPIYHVSFFQENGKGRVGRAASGGRYEFGAPQGKIGEAMGSFLKFANNQVPLLKKIVTEYLPTALKVGGTLAALL